MKYWLHSILIIVLGFILLSFIPWWTIAVIALVSAYLLKLKSWNALLFGLLAGILLWGGYAFFLDVENQHLLSSKVGSLFGGLGSIAMVSLSALLGGLLAALGSFTGASFRAALGPSK